MTLTLLAVSLNERPLSQPITAHFDASGGTIGRADHNTMALPDPERHVSRLQAEIVSQSGGNFLIRNVGAANPIVVGGRVVGRLETAKLTHGDEVRIGGYLLQVDCSMPEAALEVTRGRALRNANLTPPPSASSASSASSAASASSASSPATPRPKPPAAPAPVSVPVPSPAATPGPAPVSGSNPFADLLGPMPGPASPPARSRAGPAPAEDPFADLMPAPAGVPAFSAGLARKAGAPQARLPEDFDPFAPPSAPSLEASAPSNATDPFADLMPAGPPASIDAMLGSADGPDDALAHFLAQPPAPGGRPASDRGTAGTTGGVSTDPMQALFGDAPAPAHDAPQSDHVPALQSPFRPSRPSSSAPAPPPPSPSLARPPTPTASTAPPPPAPARSAPAPKPSPAPALPPEPKPTPAPVPAPRTAAPRREDGLQEDRAWSAFCSGAGIAVPPPLNGSEEGLRDIGRLLRSAVDGALRLMAVRASTKHELRAAVTVIQARDNNPLKFSPDANSALEVLLQPSARGFLAGPAAMDDAMHDLVGHSIGTVAGMRAAIDGMLDRFAPVELEAKLVGRSMLDNVLPSHRKAKLWDLYVQHHDSIREEAQEDFHTLFGKAFLVAYEQQISQLRRRPNAPSVEPAEPEDT